MSAGRLRGVGVDEGRCLDLNLLNSHAINVPGREKIADHYLY